MGTDVDVLILGGGCAGLSLGQRLAEISTSTRRALILEARQAYVHDRAWCFWRTAPHRYDHLVTHQWSTLQVGTAQVDCRDTPYQLLPSGAFYDDTGATIARADKVELRLDMSVTAPPVRHGEGWCVETNQGRVSAAQIIDTRPLCAPAAGGAVLWQSFFGQEVSCEAGIFHSDVCILMDFSDVRHGDVLFHYILPQSSIRALVETTVFGVRPLGVADLADHQSRVMERVCRNAAFTVLRSESGMLPMGLTSPLPNNGATYVRAGLMSGGARPSTGYAFQRIQRWAELSAHAIAGGGLAQGHAPDAFVQRLMDRLFLRVLRNHPERGAELFTRIFSTSETARVIRFLSDSGSTLDQLAIMATLPIGLFLRELGSSVSERWSHSRGAA